MSDIDSSNPSEFTNSPGGPLPLSCDVETTASAPASPLIADGDSKAACAAPPILSGGVVVVQRWHIFFVLVVIFVILTRFPALQVRPLHHDESLFAYYSHHLYRSIENRRLDYEYEPILHGPFMLNVNALFYALFGDSTYTLRLATAVFGTGIILLLIPLFRRWLGHQGMLAAMLLFAISSTMMYYSRFFRNDIPLVFFIVLGLLMALHAWRTRRAWHVFWATFLFLFPVCIKENVVMYYFSFVCFAGLMLIVDLLKPIVEKSAPLNDWFQLGAAPAASVVQPPKGRAAKDSKGRGKEAKGKSEEKPRRKKRVPPTADFFPTGNLDLLWISLAAAGIYFGLWFLHYLTFEKTFLPFVLKTWFDPRLLTGAAEKIAETHADLIRQGLILIQDGKVLLQQKESNILSPISPGIAWTFHILGLAGLFFLLLWLRWLVLREAGDEALMGRIWGILRRNHYAIVCGAAVFCVVYVLLFTTWFQSKRFFPEPPGKDATPAQMAAYKPRSVLLSYSETIIYWHGQHKEHRIKGPFHFYLPILLMYELPALLLVGGGALYAMARRRGGRIVLALWILISFILAITLPSMSFENILPKDPNNWHQEKFQSRWHFYYIAFYAYWGVVLTVHYLWRRQRFLAWTLFWFFTSLPIYSFAGEKVPWVAVHIVVPLLLAAAIYAHKLLQSPMFLRYRRSWIAAFALFVVWNVSLEIKLNFYNYDNVVERLIYGHTQRDVRDVSYKIFDYAERSGEREKLPILVKGESIWMFRWYLRHYNWTEWDNVKTTQRPIVILNWPVSPDEKNIQDNYVITKHSVRRFWQPKVLRFGVMLDIWKAMIPKQYRAAGSATAKDLEEAKVEWMKLINYIVYRKPFNPPNWQWDTVSSVDFAFCVRKDFLK